MTARDRAGREFAPYSVFVDVIESTDSMRQCAKRHDLPLSTIALMRSGRGYKLYRDQYNEAQAPKGPHWSVTQPWGAATVPGGCPVVCLL